MLDRNTQKNVGQKMLQKRREPAKQQMLQMATASAGGVIDELEGDDHQAVVHRAALPDVVLVRVEAWPCASS